MYYYKRIKDLREDNDLLQKQVCTVLECKQQQYQLYESGKREIPIHQAIRLADFYNVSLDYIAGRTNDKKGLTRSELSDDETELLKKYRSLSDNGKGKILERIDVIVDNEIEQSARTKGTA